MSTSSASLWTQGRIGHVAVDPILPVKAFMDIGGAGHSADAMAIWICQFVGREIHRGYWPAARLLCRGAAATPLEGSDHLLAARRRCHKQHHRQALRRSLERSRL